ncbi:FUSC family protein [Rhodoplanes azumiensis]|uniref:FUSC family protein n=1 Tax=Rhodoplanes azumiensis TaxID=1897628 RepID=A0ABW5ALB6_9BRAD
MLATLKRWSGLDRAALLHAAGLAGSAWLAFTIAAALYIQNAYWAAMPVFVVAQASRGLLIERAFYRMVGTGLGAALGFAIVRIGQPVAELALLAVVVAIGAGLTHILRGVHSYGTFMVGMTAAVVVFPSVLAPEHATEIAVARVECTFIGVLVVTLVMGLITPGSRRDAFYRRARKLAAAAVSFAATAIAGAAGRPSADDERAVLAEIADVDALAVMVSAGSVEGYRRLRHVNALVSAAIEIMAAGRDAGARVRRGGTLPAGLADRLQAVAAVLREPPGGTAVLSLGPELSSGPPEVARIAAALGQILGADRALFAEPGSADAASFGAKARYLAPYRDWILARDTGLAAGSATFAAGLLGWWTGFPAAELTALGICIFSMVLGSMPAPQKIAPLLFGGVVAGVLAAILYRLAIQPAVPTVGAVVLSVLPFMVVGALFRASPKTAIAAMDFNMCFLLASQAGLPGTAEVGTVLIDSFALVIAAALTSGAHLVMPRRSEIHAAGAAGSIRSDIAAMIVRFAPSARAGWNPHASRRMLRLLLHLRRAGDLGAAAPQGLLAALNLGHAVMDLQTLARDESRPPAMRSRAESALTTLAGFADDPEGVADRLEPLATIADDPALARATGAAADALRAGASLFRFGTGD